MRFRAGWRSAALALLAIAVWSGCGSQPPQQQPKQNPPPPPVAVTISPATATVTVGATRQFTATVVNAQNSAVTWSVNGTAGGNAALGTISTSGLYTAPAAVPNPASVTVNATSVQDATKSASATVTVVPPVAVTVSPATATVTVGAQQQFAAAVSGTNNSAVTWSVNGQAAGNSTVGTIDANGNFTAPVSVPSPATVTVAAASQADPKANGLALVTIVAAQSNLGISPPTATMSLDKAASASQAYRITAPAGFTGTIALSVSGLPPNVAARWDPSQLSGNGTAILTLTSASFSLGASAIPLTVTAASQASGGVESVKTASLSLNISGWQGHVRTLAGIAGGLGFEDGGGTTDEVDPEGLAADPTTDTLYAVSHHGHALRSLDLTTGTVTTLIGGPYSFRVPFGVAVAWDGLRQTVYEADSNLDAVLAYKLGAETTTLASGIDQPEGLAIAPDDSALYVTDSGNQVIDKIDLAANPPTITAVAGTFGVTGDVDGIGTQAQLAAPWGLAIDPAGRFLYFTERYTNLIRRVDLTSLQVTTLAGSHGRFIADFTQLGALAVDPHDAGGDLLYFVDNNEIRALTLGKTLAVVTIAGQTAQGFSENGAASLFDQPNGLTVIGDLSAPGATSVFVADSNTATGTMDGGNGLVRRIDVANPAAVAGGAVPSVALSIAAGQPPHAARVDGQGTGPNFDQTSAAWFDLPQGISTDGKVAFVGERGGNAVREIDLATGMVTTVAGGHDGYANGPALNAAFHQIGGVDFDAKNNLVYIADTGQSLVRLLDLDTMMVSTVAGDHQPGFADGVGTAASFNHPWGLALSPDGGTLYVTDVGNNVVRQIALATDTVTTIAGDPDHPGNVDGVGQAARFFDPTGLALTPDGKTLYISDFNNHEIRRLDLTTMAVVTVAGQGPDKCGHQDGIGTAATLCSPALMATDGRSLYWGDSLVGLVRVMNLGTGQVTTLAGKPGVLHAADGNLTEVPGGLTGSVQFNEPFGLALAPDDSFLLITGYHANVVRILK